MQDLSSLNSKIFYTFYPLISKACCTKYCQVIFCYVFWHSKPFLLSLGIAIRNSHCPLFLFHITIWRLDPLLPVLFVPYFQQGVKSRTLLLFPLIIQSTFQMLLGVIKRCTNESTRKKVKKDFGHKGWTQATTVLRQDVIFKQCSICNNGSNKNAPTPSTSLNHW